MKTPIKWPRLPDYKSHEEINEEDKWYKQHYCDHYNTVATRFSFKTGKALECICQDCEKVFYFDDEDSEE